MFCREALFAFGNGPCIRFLRSPGCATIALKFTSSHRSLDGFQNDETNIADELEGVNRGMATFFQSFSNNKSPVFRRNCWRPGLRQWHTA